MGADLPPFFLPIVNEKLGSLTRSRSSYQPKLGYSAVTALQSPFYGPESHSRDSRESLWFGRCVRALRLDNGYLQTNGEPGQGRRQPAERTLDAVSCLSHSMATGRSAVAILGAVLQRQPEADHRAHCEVAHDCSDSAIRRALLALPPGS